jgi:formylglycine-generating enzyme required for sulfatase activity
VTTLRVRDGERERRFGPADFPVPLGGPGSVVAVDAAAGPVAWLGLDGGEVFVQPVAGASLLCNGARLAASHWLRDGDVLRLQATSLEVRLRGDGVELRVAELGESNPTEPPLVLVPPPRGEQTSAGEPDTRTIAPIPFTPRPLRGPALAAPRRAPRRQVVALGLVMLAAGALLLLLSRLALVEVEVTPLPDRLALRGGWPTLRLGARRLAVSGRYTLVAEKEGYRRLEAAVELERGAVIRHALRPLPGRLVVETPGLAGAEVVVDGEAKGATPLAAFELEPGERALLVRAEGYEEHRASVVVAGRGALQSVAVTLVPLPTPPPGPPPPPRPGLLVLASDPPGARVSLEGSDRGATPVELRLPPGRRHVVRLTKPGHADAEVAVELRAGERREASARLEPQLGEVRFAARPPDAELRIDGVARGRADQALQLLAVPHEVEIRREGFTTARLTVTPRPGFPQTLRLALESLQQAREAAMPRVVKSPEGHELRLVEGGRIKMGAPRREPGRRANEPLRDVELVRPFYVATREVQNQQFRRYEPQHSSGRVGDESLDVDTQPAVNLTWRQAAQYCNWLSDRERLPRAYVERDGKLVAAVPLTTGYRLPTEAEWERIARYPVAGKGPLKYPWGSALPVPPAAGNYADTRARGLVSQVLEGYEDGFRASAPVDHFPMNALGFVGLGDNVAEWAHDLYTLTPSVEGQLVRDPVGPAEGEYHVIRGASYLHGTVTELRLSFRDYGKDARPDTGFRVARYAE